MSLFIDRDYIQLIRESSDGLTVRMNITDDDNVEIYSDCGHGRGNLIMRIPAHRVAEIFQGYA